MVAHQSLLRPLLFHSIMRRVVRNLFSHVWYDFSGGTQVKSL